MRTSFLLGATAQVVAGAAPEVRAVQRTWRVVLAHAALTEGTVIGVGAYDLAAVWRIAALGLIVVDVLLEDILGAPLGAYGARGSSQEVISQQQSYDQDQRNIAEINRADSLSILRLT